MSQLGLAQKEVMANIGRNVVMFQALEATMKRLVPLFSAEGIVSSEGVGSRHAKTRKKSLGQLVGELLQKAQFDGPEFAAQFETLVEQRNLLVHHFDETYGPDFQTEDGCARIVASLKRQCDLVSAWRNTLHGLLSAMLVCLCETQFAGTDEYADMRSLCEQLIAQVDPKYLPEFAPVEEGSQITGP